MGKYDHKINKQKEKTKKEKVLQALKDCMTPMDIESDAGL